jgi:branched-subunit amino acid transport protein
MGDWLTVLAAGVLTYASRLSMIGPARRVRLPERLQRSLRFVPAATLSAIVFLEVFRPTGALDLSPLNPRLLAAVVAVAVAWRTKSAFLTIGAGMAAFWLLRAVL